MLPCEGITRVILQGDDRLSQPRSKRVGKLVLRSDKNLAAMRPVRETAIRMPAAPTLPELYDAHAVGLFHYFTSFTGGEADAKDLLQELFIKLDRQSIPVGVLNLRAWLLRLAHHHAIDWLRKHRVRRRAEEETTPEIFAVQDDPDQAEMAKRLTQALAGLPLEQRSVAQLKLWDGLTFEEIAEVQGIPLNTAASRYRYALEKLRSELRPLYDELKPS
jgi:RNA polymerase sigma-70 factor (ECF subfamily)